MSTDDPLPSWRPGPTRDAVLGFLRDSATIPGEDRVAYFDNDGTLWCERPTYVQYQFFVDALRRRVRDDPALADRDEFRAVLTQDAAAVGALGLERVALALAGLFEGLDPGAFTREVRAFLRSGRHPALDRRLASTRYAPMLELLRALRERGFAVGVVTGGGTEFVRSISQALYGVPPERVVGTMIGYELGQDASGRPALRRSARVLGDVNEGGAKVTNIQTQLGRPPVLAAGNSAGDQQLLEWAAAAAGPHLALLLDHDDPDREFAYASRAESFTSSEPVTATARRLGWTTISMKHDWESVFVADDGPWLGTPPSPAPEEHAAQAQEHRVSTTEPDRKQETS
ncbi:HAD family hydrolase [Myceligenerans indicum]|uniref:Haloacid dehalogenase-like hydrolase n=1 Tax=Myceligenerans indicum TaxID=2593663 RepID=A0ABS1LFW8_9MICO|nr:HAD family hydrolase [Myceligenerans indicum]MBL0885136.1 haloacid dehalogenase-like hydrolase [Myceligenerans indicum]